MYLEKLQKSLVREGYEVPDIRDTSEDGLFRYAKFLEGVLYFTRYDDFFGRMHSKFYEEYVRERDEALRKSKEVKNIINTSLTDDSSTTMGYSKNNPFSEMLSLIEQQEGVASSQEYMEEEFSNNWEDEDEPSNNWGTEDEEFSNNWEDNVEEVEDSYSNNWEDEDDFANNWEDEDEEIEDLDKEDKSSLNSVFDIEDTMLEEFNKVSKESTDNITNENSLTKGTPEVKRELSSSIKKNNQTIDMLGSWFGGSKKGKKRK